MIELLPKPIAPHQPSWLRACALSLAFIIAVAAAGAQEPPDETEVFGFESDPFAEFNEPSRIFNPPQADSSELETAAAPTTIVVHEEPDGSYLSFNNFLTIIQTFDPTARGEWDGLMGMFRLTVSGRSLQVLANQPVLVIDGRYRPVEKPLRVRGATVLVPLESARIIAETIGLALELEQATSRAQTSTPRKVAPPARGADAALPSFTPSSPDPSQTRAAARLHTARSDKPERADATPTDSEAPLLGGLRSNRLLTGISIVSPRLGEALAPIQIPAVGASVAGLTWGQLVDFAHDRAPDRIVLTSDSILEPLADRIAQFVTRALAADVAVIVIEDRRHIDSILSDLNNQNPDIVLDLIADSTARGGGDGFALWTVHEALWPGIGSSEDAAARPLNELYRIHQFQSLALGSMLRGELARGFPNREIRHSLAPVYLLRRSDAPSASLVIPVGVFENDGAELDRCARAAAGGLIAYCRGIQTALDR